MESPVSILVPVDFSNHSLTAYEFALGMSEAMDASVKLVHVVTGDSKPQNLYPITSSTQASQAKLEQSLKEFAEKPKAIGQEGSTKTKIKMEVVPGLTVAGELTEMSKEFDLVVVGARGENMISKKLFGNIPTLLSQRAHCPVMVIPNQAEFFVPKKILYASNWESADDDFIRQMVSIASFFRSQVNFVHISQDYGVDNFEAVKEEIFETLEEYSDLEFSYLILDAHADSPMEGIQQFAEENQMDWIVLVNRQRGLFNNILGLSMSKELSLKPGRPLLIFQDDD
ncbi:MAG: universal stress protein [Saprospiraceae bacterium]|nr:universal stress protein [Saprospiraceae bacterium]